MQYHILHETRYSYTSPVALSHQLLHLTPRAVAWQTVLSHAITIDPAPAEQTERKDDFGNPVRQLLVATPHQSLVVHAESEVVVRSRAKEGRVGAEGRASSPRWETARDRLASLRDPPLDPAQFVFESPHVPCLPELAHYAASSFKPRRDLLHAALDLAARIHADFEFDPKATSISTPLAQVLKLRRGVCQDFAHLMIGCLRSIGLAARYVSGYLLTVPPPGRARLVGADASHAWVALWSARAGWIDLDPTNNCLVDDEHVCLGWGRDFGDVTPMRGVILGGGEQDLAVRVTVTPRTEAAAPAPIESGLHG
jgi:transglutaminase-like putative cysteine protease